MENTRIISDIHLGSDNCQAKALCEFLEDMNKSHRLIINGDFINSMDFRRLKKYHWNVLSLLRKLSNKMQVILIGGNHDGDIETISHLLGIEVVEEYRFSSGGKKVLALHGHQFDDFIDNHPTLTWVCDAVYQYLQKIDKTHSIARFAKHSSKQYLRCTENIKTKAIEYASGFDIVCVGHTHHAVVDKSREVCYCNSGCWTEKPCTYLEISNGKVELGEFML